MGGSSPKTPTVVTIDPVAEQRKAEALATQKSNAEVAMRARTRRGQRLATDPQGFGPPPKSLMASAKPATLGGGAGPPAAAPVGSLLRPVGG